MKYRNYLLSALVLAGVTMFTAGCGSSETKSEESTEEATQEITEAVVEPAKAMASMAPASGSNVSGTIEFVQTGDNTVEMTIEIQHLSPGKHAIHRDEIGDCSAPDATSAGGHWNPMDMPHGNRMEGEHHAGDIINLEAGSDSTATNTVTIEGWTIGGDEASNIVGKAVVIHAGEDDFTSQPSGAAGARVSCGVIRQQ